MRGPGLKNGIFLLTILFLVCAVYTYGSPSDHMAFRGRERLRDEVYINLAVDKVDVDKREAVRGDKITFTVTLHNKGEVIRGPVVVRAVSGQKTLTSKLLSNFYWDVKDKMEVILVWDTSNTEPGSYPVKVEAPLFEDEDDFDNDLKLSFEIVIR